MCVCGGGVLPKENRGDISDHVAFDQKTNTALHVTLWGLAFQRQKL